ncbi:MAG: family 78 glycoside hydrolase catalytic domain [bacterium]|nr:family 78 glycoside hydrolase catalytic domain [bacterium]
MKITNLKVNHLYHPLGYDYPHISLSWLVLDTFAKKQKAARVQISVSRQFDTESIVYDSGEDAQADSKAYHIDLTLKSYTRYYWKVQVWTDCDEFAESEISYFEAAKLQDKWSAEWISPKNDYDANPYIEKIITIGRKVRKARAYVCGLGLYEMYINDCKVGDEYLLPGYHAYDSFLEYQTFDVTDAFQYGANSIGFYLGEGWYKGRFVFDGGYKNIYGDRKAVICEIHVIYEDDTEEIVATNRSWNWKHSGILENGIYDGEIVDLTLHDMKWKDVETISVKEPLVERSNPPIVCVKKIQPVAVLHTVRGDIILDFGQNITGWVTVDMTGTEKADIRLVYGEILQNGFLHRENLRTAKAEFRYKGPGMKGIRPKFTYFGFRYVQVEGIKEVTADCFTACVIMSQMDETGTIKTSNAKLNQLFQNTLWGQRDNFLDIPIDCPQRDERMGWTGDTTIFCGTACFNMDTSAFYAHYIRNIRAEQLKMNGAVPFFAPYPKIKPHEGINLFLQHGYTCTWGDVATILPWNLFIHYGDRSLLAEHYPMMRDWVIKVSETAHAQGNILLWQGSDQLGDWLALDNGNLHNPIGKTDPDYIASMYYYKSVSILSAAAKELHYQEDQQRFDVLKQGIYTEIIKTYFHKDGSLRTIETQTALAIALAFQVFPEGKSEILVNALVNRIKSNNGKLDTGFVGTPLICNVLSDYGRNEMAYTVLLNEEYPGWLYEINMGATTVWERWNSILEDGTMNEEGMNSLNHYAYGAIVEWMYRRMCGFHPSEKETGCSRMELKPMPNPLVREVWGEYVSVMGTYKMGWKYRTDHKIIYHISVPFHTTAVLYLQNGDLKELDAGEYEIQEG